MNNVVFMFDIDGCILPNLFENYGWAKNQDRATVIREVNERGKNASLFPNFVTYFGMHCKDAVKIFFITGRQENEFFWLTIRNLQELGKFRYDFDIIWYPSNKKHEARTYFKWKVDTIKKLMKGLRAHGVKYAIFDDLPDYFLKLRKFANKRGIECHVARRKSNEDWKRNYAGYGGIK